MSEAFAASWVEPPTAAIISQIGSCKIKISVLPSRPSIGGDHSFADIAPPRVPGGLFLGRVCIIAQTWF
jgi:hypothetical protein